MSALVVRKDETGKLVGIGEKGARAWAKFRRQVDAMQVGDTLGFEWRAPRCPVHHRRFFAQLHNLFDAQERFEDVDRLRAWLTVGAGYCDFVPGPDHQLVALPRSINWERMDEAEFSELHVAVCRFLYTAEARRFLWPHLTEFQTFDIVNNWENGRG